MLYNVFFFHKRIYRDCGCVQDHKEKNLKEIDQYKFSNNAENRFFSWKKFLLLKKDYTPICMSGCAPLKQ